MVEQPSGRRSSNGIGAVRPARILLLEDDGRLRQMLCEGLQEEGFEVTPAADGVEALALVGIRGPFDLLLLDDEVPWLTGRQLLRLLRVTGLRTAAVFYSGDLELTGAEQAALGVSAVLSKPLLLSELAAAIRRAIAQTM